MRRSHNPAHFFATLFKEDSNMDAGTKLFFYSSEKSDGLFCYSRRSDTLGLPEQFSPWQAIGVLRGDQQPPYGLPRRDIESGLKAKGYQLLRKRKPVPAKAAKRPE